MSCATGKIESGKFTAGPWADPWYVLRKIQLPRPTDLWVLTNNAARRVFLGNHREHKPQYKQHVKSCAIQAEILKKES